MREHPAFMQHDDIVAIRDFVDEMRGPEHRHGLRGDQPAHVAQNIGPRLDVEAHRRLVEHEQAWPVQQRARDLDPPHLAAGQIAYLVVRALRQGNAGQHVVGAPAAFMLADAVQRRMVGQILDDREIEVERARLEHDADQAQGFARCPFDIVPENPDTAALDRVEARHQREQGALSGAVEAEENGEGRWRDREAHVIERLAGAVEVADALDGDGRRLARAHSMHYGPRRSAGKWQRRHRSETATPQGNSPTWIVLITLRLATSMMETSFDTPLVVRRYFSSGVNAVCQTRWPTRRYF